MSINPIPSNINESPLSLICSITFEVMRDPVIDKHGHTFECAAIEEWISKNNTCPLNRQPLSLEDLAPNRALKDVIESFGEGTKQDKPDEEAILRSPGPVQNDNLANPLLNAAKEVEKKEQYPEAEKLYKMALEYTSKSEDYAHLPQLFEKMGQKGRASHSYVVLSDLQLKENEHDKAIGSLRKSLQLVEDVEIKEKLAELLVKNGQIQEAATHFLELTQHALYHKDTLKAAPFCRRSIELFPGNPETWKMLAALEKDPVRILMQGAQELLMPIKERIALCKMVLVKDSINIEARFLQLELKQAKMKEKIKQLKQVEQLNRTKMKAEINQLKQDAFKWSHPKQFGKKEWENKHGLDIGEEPPISPEIVHISSTGRPCVD